MDAVLARAAPAGPEAAPDDATGGNAVVAQAVAVAEAHAALRQLVARGTRVGLGGHRLAGSDPATA